MALDLTRISRFMIFSAVASVARLRREADTLLTDSR
jgi:hypothetical protein